MSLDKLVLSSGNEHLLLSINPDWPSIIVTGAIGLGSIFTSIAVVRISRINQRSQSNAKIAELRQGWLNEMRDSMATFCSLASMISVRSKVVDSYHLSDEATENYQELLYIRSKILMMLDQNKDYTQILSSLMKEILSIMAKDTAESAPDTRNLIRALEEQSQKVLEKAWGDIKQDLAK